MKSVNRWLQAIVLFSAAFVVGCGGGGGSETEGLPLGLKFSFYPARFVDQTYVVGERFSAEVTGHVEGEMLLLKGKTVYVILEDPTGLFDSNASISFREATPNGVNYSLKLLGKLLTKAERLTGTLVIRVCLDLACKIPLGRRPLTVAYDFTVHERLAVSRNAIQVEVPFGTVPPPETVDVTWPAASKGYFQTLSWITNEGRPISLLDFVSGANTLSTAPQIQVKFLGAKPGTYVTVVQLRMRYLSAEVKVTYIVKPNPALDHFLFP